MLSKKCQMNQEEVTSIVNFFKDKLGPLKSYLK